MRTKTITIDGYNKPDSAYHGNMFLTGNGAMGVRGTLCEYRKEYMPAINLGGVYDQVGMVGGSLSMHQMDCLRS